jgi:hypothetical protein
MDWRAPLENSIFSPVKGVGVCLAGDVVKLEDHQPEANVRGILPDAGVTVVGVERHGSDALTLVYRAQNGRVADKILYRHDEPHLDLIQAGRMWNFVSHGSPLRTSGTWHSDVIPCQSRHRTAGCSVLEG